MRLPKRVPWAHLSELDEVCNWIYGSESTLDSRVSAVNRLAAWKMNTALPHSLDSTHALLQVIVEDSKTSLDDSRSRLGLGTIRQAYAMAIVRLVNGLVDPLQQGMYARPIASIAAQIGLPGWFIELRHGATHEDLPSLEVLREGAKEALNWLLYNYFIPTLNRPSNSAQVNRTVPLSPLAPLLKQYKSLMKLSTRDASLTEQHKPEIARLLRTLERWIGEAKVAAGMDVAASNEGDEDGDWRENWALEKVCQTLIDRGGLVPVSKKKRTQGSSDDELELPPNQAIWTPLLVYLESSHPAFPAQLLSQFTHFFGAGVPSEPMDRSYELSIAGWTLWVVETWPHLNCGPQDAVCALLLGLVDGERVGRDIHVLRLLIRKLAASSPSLGSKAELLLKVFEQRGCAPEMGTSEGMIEEMQKRMELLSSYTEDEQGSKEVTPDGTHMEGVQHSEAIAPGWRLLGLHEWKPCPLGVFGNV